jgi:acyl-CoA synthetase (AMP-forming)/AMP-acid ligase II
VAAVSYLSSGRFDSYVGVLSARAAEYPNSLAFRFVDDNGAVRELTYSELDRLARMIAARILDATGSQQAPVLLLSEPGPDYIAGLFACFYAAVPAVPAFPPGAVHLSRALSRLLSIILDAKPQLVLTTENNALSIKEWLARALEGNSPDILQTDDFRDSAITFKLPASCQPIAVLQYTSGSTFHPRGVILSHDQLIANSVDIIKAFELRDDSLIALWLPPYHDMGLIGGVLVPIAVGTPMTFMSPQAFLRRPERWLQMVSRYRTTVTGGPNFAYDLCVRRVKETDLDGIDLSCLEVAFTGAEPVRPDTITRFADRFEPYGFRRESIYPCYGLAEATLYVAGGGRVMSGWNSVSVSRRSLELDGVARATSPGEPSRTLVSCGAPERSTRLLVVDPATRDPVRPGHVGEIWIGSPSVAVGYWQQPAETEETFRARTVTGDGPFLRTGDLGFVREGELFIVGRRKDLIVLNGRNYHPVDIECVCESSVEGIRRNGGAAFSVADDLTEEERVIVVYEIGDDSDDQQRSTAISGIRKAISLEIGIALHAVVLVEARTVPKTSSGKVQRWLCQRQYLRGELKEVAAWRASTGKTQRADPEPGGPLGNERMS